MHDDTSNEETSGHLPLLLLSYVPDCAFHSSRKRQTDHHSPYASPEKHHRASP